MVADLCKKYNVIVFADEVYEWLVFDDSKHIRIGKNSLFLKHCQSIYIIRIVFLIICYSFL